MYDATTTDEYQTPASIPLYLSALIATLCGLYAVFLLLEDVPFTQLTMGLTFIGFLVSFVSRKMKIPPRTIEVPAVVICATLALLAVLSDQMITVLAPPTVGDDRARALAVLLTWLVVFRSFTLLTDGALLFCCVPTIAMMGLVGTMSSDFTLTTAFIVFVCAAAFMMVHENFLRTRPMDGSFQRARMERVLFGSQVQLAVFCGAGAVLLANIVAAPLRTLGSALLFSASFANQNVSNTQVRTTSRVAFSEREEILVATGPVRVSDTVFMRVRAESGHRWRGATLDYYTGRGWFNTLSSGQALERVIENDSLFDQGFNTLSTYRVPRTLYTQVGAKSHSLRQVVTLVNGGLFSEIYAAPEARTIQTEQVLQATSDMTGSIHLRTPLQNVRYVVTSEVPDWSPDTLRRIRADYPEEIKRFYLQLPPGRAMDNIRQTAEQVTSGFDNPYDKVAALEAWVSERCSYNLNAPAAPVGVDVAENFLFSERQGYCDSFATALTVLCRSIGIPARIASGFQTGELNQLTQEYEVRERDKHLWTEVYFPTVGWVDFDATRGAEEITDSAGGAGGNRRSSLLGFLFRRGWLPPTALFIFLCMLGYVLKVEVWDRLRARGRAVNPLGLPETNLAIVETYEAACDLFARRGLARPDSATPLEYLTYLTERLAERSEARDALERLTQLVVRFRYSRQTARADDVRLAQEALAALQHALKGVNRRALLAVSEG